MAQDWIKMRVGLAKDPRVIAMADFLAEHRPFMCWLTDATRHTCKETAYEYVTRNVTVSVTVAALLQIWGVANEAGKADGDDLVLRHTRLDALDEVSGVPGFGDAMAYVEWAAEEECKGKPCVRLPKFLINNVPAEDRAKKSAAERQRRYRERHNGESDANRNVTRDVTVTDREDKRREEVKERKELPPTAGDDAVALMISGAVDYITATGVGQKQARSLVGMLRKSLGDVDATQALAKMQAEQVADPTSWIAKAAKRKPAANGSQFEGLL